MGDVLVERDPFISPLLEWVPDAETRTGRLVLLGGEAGVGKTSLVGLLATRVGPDVTVRRGFGDNVATPSPLGPVLDALPELTAAIEEATSATRPRLFREVPLGSPSRPTLLVLEDVHWADEATLELVALRRATVDGCGPRGPDVPRRQVGPGDALARRSASSRPPATPTDTPAALERRGVRELGRCRPDSMPGRSTG